MKKIFLFVALYFFSLNSAVINEKTSNNGISLTELSKTKTFKMYIDYSVTQNKESLGKLCKDYTIIDLSNLNLNNIEDIENLKVYYDNDCCTSYYDASSDTYYSDNTDLPEFDLLKDIKGVSLRLNLSGNQIEDLSPLNSLTNLEVLDLNNNQIKDISRLNPNNLYKLILSNNSVTDFSNLSSLTGLRNLDLSNNNIEDLSTLNSLTQLVKLDLSNNKIKDISSLSSLSLYSLNLNNNQVINIFPLEAENQKNLRILSLSNNEVTDISPLRALTKLKYLNLSNNKIKDIANLSYLIELISFNISNNQLNNIDVICEYKKLEKLDLSNNQLTSLPECIINLIKLSSLNLYKTELNIKYQVLQSLILKEGDRYIRYRAVIIFRNPDNSINMKISKFLTRIANNEGLFFMPSQFELLDQLPTDIKYTLLPPFLKPAAFPCEYGDDSSQDKFIDEIVPNNGVSLAELSKTKKFHYHDRLNLSNSNLNSIYGIENLKVRYKNELTEIKNIPNLFINLRNNRITDISPLNSLTNLFYIDLRDNQITDTSALKSLSLKNMYL